ncbi:MAG: DNA gyrase inhibitor YacG [Isosphaerales bacterium]
MIRGRCPTCSRSYEIAALDELRSFPFCSDRCRLIDLGRWIDGKYVVPASNRDEQETVPEEDASEGD